MKIKFSRIALLLSLFSLLLITVGMVAAKKYSFRGPWIGVHMQSIDEDMREAYELADVDGIFITEVSDDSPADDAGLRRRDIIIKFGGKKVTEPDFLVDLVEDSEIGDEVEITYLRRGKEKTAMIEIGRKPRSESYTLFFDRANNSKNLHRQYSYTRASRGHIGTAIQSLNDQLAEYFGVDEGVLVTEVFEDSPAEEAGLKAGDVIISADGETVEEIEDLTDIVSDKDEGDRVEIGYVRRGSKKKVTVEITEDTFGSSYFSAPHMYGYFSTPEVPPIPAIPEIPAIPSFRTLGHFLHDDDYYFDNSEYKEAMEDYRDEMKDLRRELKEMNRELREIKKKLE